MQTLIKLVDSANPYKMNSILQHSQEPKIQQEIFEVRAVI